MKAKLQLTVKGRPVLIPIHLSEDQLKELTSTMNIEDIASGWEEPQIGQTGYYEDEFNEVKSFEITKENIDFAHRLYENDNFFSTLEAAENTVRADNVLRRLRHYAISHRATDQTMAEGGYTIGYNYQDQCLEISATGQWLTLGDMVFDTEEIARKAMNKFASDLFWYFSV